MWNWYHRILSRRPILVQSVSTAILFGTGDVIAQQAVERKGFKNHDFARTARMSAFGGVVAGPLFSTWYRFLETRVKAPSPFRALVGKVALDQLICAPGFIAVFFTAQGIFEKLSVNEIKEKLHHGYVPALMNNYKIWPMVQLVNFYFTPLYYRVMVTNLVALGWNAYLSIANQQSKLAVTESPGQH